MMMEDDGGVAAPKVYAKFSTAADRKNQFVTLSNGNLTAVHIYGSHRAVFLDTDKTSGKWAIEVTNTGYVACHGFATTMDLAAKIGLYAQGVGYQTVDGSRNYHVSSNVTDISYWRNYDAGVKFVLVLDFDNRQILVINQEQTALRSSAIGSIGSPLYVGISLYEASATINAGQSAFSAGNEALIAAYELANGVTINRGLWA